MDPPRTAARLAVLGLLAVLLTRESLVESRSDASAVARAAKVAAPAKVTPSTPSPWRALPGALLGLGGLAALIAAVVRHRRRAELALRPPVPPALAPPVAASWPFPQGRQAPDAVGAFVPRLEEEPDPLVRLQMLAAADVLLRVGARPPAPPWGAAVATLGGYVRAENQDTAAAFAVGPHEVIVVADGCGGLPRGREAARVATAAAVASLAADLSASHLPRLDAVRRAFSAASEGLRLVARAYRDPDTRGLRSTLLIAIAGGETFTVGYLGDGSVVHVDVEGRSLPLFEPMRSEQAGAALTGSVGPEPYGEVQLLSFAARSGDALVLGTDGVFDRVDDDFARELVRHAEDRGDVRPALDEMLALLTAHRDAAGYVYDDNVTLGLLLTGRARPVSNGGPAAGGR
ncbi:MAG: protein phosphatase 2C domain-containing protein [Deltaproteobacteria bacterium]|nr:protein phosphatase 2C domain-containing protein [Myxococcales bacterium]MDP3216474.1 protein phosphatase 2C domain-containing protein [Deltaproteobacteria bacterium]